MTFDIDEFEDYFLPRVRPVTHTHKAASGVEVTCYGACDTTSPLLVTNETTEETSYVEIRSVENLTDLSVSGVWSRVCHELDRQGLLDFYSNGGLDALNLLSEN